MVETVATPFVSGEKDPEQLRAKEIKDHLRSGEHDFDEWYLMKDTLIGLYWRYKSIWF